MLQQVRDIFEVMAKQMNFLLLWTDQQLVLKTICEKKMFVVMDMTPTGWPYFLRKNDCANATKLLRIRVHSIMGDTFI